MTSDDRPPMPAAPPPAHEPPPTPAPAPLPPTAAPGELVDSVPGAAPAGPAGGGAGGLILPSDLPTWAPPAEPADGSGASGTPPDGPIDTADAGDTIPVSTFLSQLAEAHQRPEEAQRPEAAHYPEHAADDDDAGDTIAATAGSFDHLILSPEPDPAPPAPPATAAAEETQRGWDTSGAAGAAPVAPPSESAPQAAPGPAGFQPEFAPPAGFTPPSGFQPPPGFAPPAAAADSDFGLSAPTMVGGAGSFQPPAAGGAHANPGPSGGGRGRLAALIGGLVVLAALIVGGFFLFHGSSKKTPVAAPTPSAVVSAAPSAAPASTAPSVAPTSGAPSPTVDANLAGTQAKALQTTIIKSLKSLVALDATSAGVEESCMFDETSAFSGRGAERSSLLAMLHKLDVTAMQDSKTWKGLLEQAMAKDITVDQELTAWSKDLKTTCTPATVKNDAHYKKAITDHEASVSIQKKFVASFNPVAKTYNIPQQSAGNI